MLQSNASVQKPNRFVHTVILCCRFQVCRCVSLLISHGRLGKSQGPRRKEVWSEKLGGGLLPASENPYPIYDHTLRFSQPYLWTDHKFDTLFMTVAADTVALNITYEGLLLVVLSTMTKSSFFQKNTTKQKTRVQKPYSISDQNGQNRYLIYDQNGWKTIPFGAAHAYIAHIRDYPPGVKVSALGSAHIYLPLYLVLFVCLLLSRSSSFFFFTWNNCSHCSHTSVVLLTLVQTSTKV